MSDESLVETVTLGQAKSLIQALAHRHSLLLLSPPGVGKSDTVLQAAAEAGLPCRSLLGTQIAPEDVSGVPRIVGERTVFCPPRVLLPETPEKFCLFLDEMPASAPDVQKAFYSLLLERRIGEYPLPRGSWVVAAGNRAQDKALVRSLSSALVNRVIVLNVRIDVKEWLVWARSAGLREEILAFIAFMPDALMRPVPPDPVPFSTPRSWASLSDTLSLAEAAGLLTRETRRALAFGRLSGPDAAIFCAMAEEQLHDLQPLRHYLESPWSLPAEDTACWFVLNQFRSMVSAGKLEETLEELPDGETVQSVVNRFLSVLRAEHRMALLVGLVPQWGLLGADASMLRTLKEVTGLDS